MSPYRAEIQKYQAANSHTLYIEERLHRYQPGGYHPVSIDDTFSNGRYKIYNKLGFGGYSTVWLALDEPVNQWVAIKILTAEKSKDDRELQSHQRLAELPQEFELSRWFVQLYDHFWHEGPNGTHLCLVTEVLGPGIPMILQRLSDKKTWLPPNTVVKIAEQLLEAIEALHKAGFAHGDLNIRNIVFTCHNLALSEDGYGIWERVSDPYCVEMVRKDGKPLDSSVPKEYVETESWDDWDDQEVEDIKIVDLSEVFSQGETPPRCVLPFEYRAPEIVFEDSFDHRTDLWVAGAVIYELVFHMLPFGAIGGYIMLVLTMMDVLGDLPPEWVPRWKSMQADSDRDPTISRLEEDGLQPDAKLYSGKRNIPEETLRILVPVIKGLLTWKRSDRLSATQALELLRRLKAQEGLA